MVETISIVQPEYPQVTEAEIDICFFNCLRAGAAQKEDSLEFKAALIAFQSAGYPVSLWIDLINEACDYRGRAMNLQTKLEWNELCMRMVVHNMPFSFYPYWDVASDDYYTEYQRLFAIHMDKLVEYRRKGLIK